MRQKWKAIFLVLLEFLLYKLCFFIGISKKQNIYIAYLLMQRVYLEKNQYYNLSWYFPLFNPNHYLKCWKWEYCPMFASYLQLVWGTLSSHFKWWSLYFKTSISSHLWGGDEPMGDTRTQNVTHNEDINVITTFLDRNLKFECR